MIQPVLDRQASQLVPREGARVAAIIAMCVFASACGDLESPEEEVSTDVSAIIQTCRATNVQGAPYAGITCGGSVIDNCSKGVLYSCKKATGNNCTFSQSCSIGCLTGPNSTPPTVNTNSPQASDACFNGAAPLTLSTTSTQGGNYVTMTATLQQSHNPFAVVNLTGTTPEVPPLCNVPVLMPANATTVSWVEPTGVVSSVTNVPLSVLTSFNDSSGKSRALVAVPTTLTLNPGGSISVPPLATFRVTDPGGNDISTIVGGTNAFAVGTISMPAPVGGVNVTVTDNPSSAFVTSGAFSINVGCTSSSTSGVLTATSSLSSNLSATVSATTGVGGSLSKNVTITPPALAIQSIALNPSTVQGGSALTATIQLNRNVLASDPSSLTSVRISEGLVSGAKLATFAGCTGSPVCTGPITVPVGSSSASFSITTSSVTTQDILTVSVDATWSCCTASAQLTINP